MADSKGITTFDRMRAVVYGGWWAKMTLLERGVWLVLLANSDYRSGVVRDLPQDKLAVLAGCNNLNRMRDAIRRIDSFGLVQTEDAGGGFGKVPRRRMLAPKPFWDSPLFDQAEAMAALSTPDESDAGGELFGESTGPVNGPVFGPNYGAGDRPFTGPVTESYGAGERPFTGPVNGPLYHQSPNHTPHHPPASPLRAVSKTRGTTGMEEEVERFLKEKGVWAHSAKKLATLVSLSDAREIWQAVVGDASVKNRKAAFYVRLKDFTELPPPASDAAAS